MNTLISPALLITDINEADAEILRIYFKETLIAAGHKDSTISINLHRLVELYLVTAFIETAIIISGLMRNSKL